MTSVGTKDLETRLRQCEMHLALMTRIAVLANEARDVDYFMSRCLAHIAKSGGWLVAQVWYVDEAEEALTCSGPWYSPTNIAEFRRESIERRLSKGEGLPGRVWGTGTAVWIEDVCKESSDDFTRGVVAAKYGLKAAFAFAVRTGPFVMAILEFFAQDARAADQQDLLFFEKLGTYLGMLMTDKQSQQKLYESELTNRIILNESESAFVRVDLRGSILEWNRQAEKTLGWTREEVIGQPLADLLIPSRHKAAYIQGIFSYLSTGQARMANKRVRAPAVHREGHEVTLELFIFRIQVMDSKSFGAFFSDVSQQLPPPEIVLE